MKRSTKTESAKADPKAQTRQAVIVAATALFSARGFHGVAIPEIAERAGVGVGTIYRHFTDKNDLGNEVYRQCKRAMAAATWSRLGSGEGIADESAVGKGDPYRAEFLVVWMRLFNYALAHQADFQFLELHHHPDYLDAHSLQVQAQSGEPIQRFFERGIKAGAIAALPVAVLVGLSWGALVGVVRQSLAGGLALDAAMILRAGQSAWQAIAAPRPNS